MCPVYYFMEGLGTVRMRVGIGELAAYYSSSMIRYDTIGEFNVDSKAKYSALSIAHVARKRN